MGKLTEFLSVSLDRCAQLERRLGSFKSERREVEANTDTYAYTHGKNWQTAWWAAIWDAEVEYRKKLNSLTREFNVLAEAVRARVPGAEDVRAEPELSEDPQMNEYDDLPEASKCPLLARLKQMNFILEDATYRETIGVSHSKLLVVFGEDRGKDRRVSASFNGKTFRVTGQQKKFIQVLDEAHAKGEAPLRPVTILKRAKESGTSFARAFRADKKKLNEVTRPHLLVQLQ